MWKVVTGIVVVALAVFFLLRHEPNEAGEQSVKETGTVSLSGTPADAQPSSQSPSSAAPRNAASDDTVQPHFTSYETKPAKHVTKSTTGTVIVFPDGRRSPAR